MRLPEVVRTTAFRSALAVAASFGGLTLVLFMFVSWRVTVYERQHLDAEISHESRTIADPATRDPAHQLRAWLKGDTQQVRYAALFGPDGLSLVGNISALPAELPPDGMAREVVVASIDQNGDEEREIILAVARNLDDGRLLVVGHDTDQIEELHVTLMQALVVGLVPTLALSLAIGAALGGRTDRRVRAFQEVVGRVMQGQLGGRVPVSEVPGDEFDRLGAGLNAMLTELERLIEEIRSVGDSIAHDLRTPLTRMRVRLERSRNMAHTPAEFQEAVDRALGWTDQMLRVITAVLRIGELEHGRRRAAVTPVDLAPLVLEAAEFYDPMAEDKAVRLCVHVGPVQPVLGDRDLIFEALANLIDNAIKFTPAGGEVCLSLADTQGSATIRVEDNGAGIPVAERDKVLKRFYRSDPSRHHVGSGLGLSLVAAIARLHGFGLAIGGEKGCVIELTCPLVGVTAGPIHEAT